MHALAAHCGLWLAFAAGVLALRPVVAGAQEEGELTPRLPFEPRAVEIQFTDGSNLRLHLADEPIEMLTPHGKLRIPAEDVLRVEFALRLSEAVQQQIDDLLTQLRSEDEEMRNVATEGLLLMGEKAIPAIAKAAKSGDPAIAPHAAEVLAHLRAQFPEAERLARQDDLVETPDTKVAGQITNPKLKLLTSQFGELAMNLADARSLRHQSYIPAEQADSDPKGVRPDPGNLKAYEQRVNETFRFTVMAASGGSIWGTDTYTTDTRLSTAVIHAGVLKEGETGVVQVKIVPGQPSYAGSARHGVTSSGYGAYGGSYQIIKPEGGRGMHRMKIMRGGLRMLPK